MAGKCGQLFHFLCSKGRKVAIDASMCLYQFLIAVRTDGAQLTDQDGDPTRFGGISEFHVIVFVVLTLYLKVLLCLSW